ncbi:MAG: NAD(P)/FAD-dependent oxidoreductase [Pseudopelagicola sp.]|nr:NAD(P)/FAD-dependent oxidoreductase [Pseudopelagicola sp.]
MSHIAIIGAGQAGAAMAAKLRNLGFDGRLSLIGEETAPPYQRPPLSKKYMSGEMALERLYLRPEHFYRDQKIDLRLGTKVAALEAAEKKIELATGEVLDCDQIALCTGAAPIHLPSAVGGDLDGVYVMRGLADADAMAGEFIEGRHVLIVGGGYIGLEAAAVAASKGLQVTLVEMAPRILARVASAETADWFRDLHQSHGVDLREGVGLSALHGEAGRVTRASLGDGSEIAVDFVIAGIGVRPCTALAEQAGLVLENGIRVDGFGETSVAGIYAAGDCASFPLRGCRIRLESVPNAIDQAEAAAAAMLGQGAPYQAKPWFWSDQYDVKLQIAGLNTGFDAVVIRKGDKPRSQSHWYFKGSCLLAVDAMNDPRAYMIGKRLIEAGQSPLKGPLADPETPLKTLPLVTPVAA